MLVFSFFRNGVCLFLLGKGNVIGERAIHLPIARAEVVLLEVDRPEGTLKIRYGSTESGLSKFGIDAHG